MKNIHTKNNDDFLVIAIASFIFALIIGASLLVTEEEIAAFTARLFG